MTRLDVSGSQWIRASLSAGKRLSEALLLSRFLDRGSAYLLGTLAGIASYELCDPGESVNHLNPAIHDESICGLFTLLNQVTEIGVLVIEDDLRTSGDPALKQFVEEEIARNEMDIYHVRSADNLGLADDLEKFIGKSAFGFPLNGFVLRGLDLSLVRSLVQRGNFIEIASHCYFTFHAIYDGDAVAVWIPDDVARSSLNSRRPSDGE